MQTKTMIVSLALLVVIALGTSCTLPGTSNTQTSDVPTISTTTVYASPVVDTKPIVAVPDFISVIAQVKPSVVAITTEVPVRIFGRQFTQEGAGSGWIIDANGFIVTNSHVVEGAKNVSVTLADGRTFSAVSVETNSASDLAVIRINAQGLPAIQIGKSSDLQVGEWVVAIGDSLGLGISATKGIVSALGVTISTSPGETLKDLIQTDAAINPGNSGGPLVNVLGQVVGINTVKVAQVGVEGMGYAISIDEAKPIIAVLLKKS